jgi:hypothetical protein
MRDLASKSDSTHRVLFLFVFDKLEKAHVFLRWTLPLEYFMSPGSDKVKFQLSQQRLTDLANTITHELKTTKGRDNQWQVFGKDPLAPTELKSKVSKLMKSQEEMEEEIIEGALRDILVYQSAQTAWDGWACTKCSKLHRAGEAARVPPPSAMAFTCAACTFYNEHDGQKCTVCEAPRPSRKADVVEPAKLKKSSLMSVFKRKQPAASDPLPSKPQPQGIQEIMEWCAGCSACRRHGERECHSCVL